MEKEKKKEINRQVKKAHKEANKGRKKNAKIYKESKKLAPDYRSPWFGIVLGILSFCFFILLFIPAVTFKGESLIDPKNGINMFQAFFGFTAKGLEGGQEQTQVFVGEWWYSSLVFGLILIGAIFYCFMSNSLIFSFIGMGCDIAGGVLLVTFFRTNFSIANTEAPQISFADVTTSMGVGFWIVMAYTFFLALLGLIFSLSMIHNSKNVAYNEYLHGKKLSNY